VKFNHKVIINEIRAAGDFSPLAQFTHYVTVWAIQLRLPVFHRDVCGQAGGSGH